jgi:molybdopterin-guanine dinucleotide biosynthesis protein A
MGGPKAWLTLGPEFFLERVVRILKDVVDPIVVVAAEGQDLPVLPESVVIVRDHVPERGPLQGLATGLEALTDDIELAYLSATDAPLINLAHIE